MALSQNIIAFDVRFYDGQDWLSEWSEVRTGLPQMVEVNLAAQLGHEKNILRQSFLVNFPRWPKKVNHEKQ